MKHFIGIDNSSLTHSIYIINENEKKIKEFNIENNLYGFKKLEESISKYPNSNIGFELSHGPLIDYLREKNECNMYSLNPLKIKRFKQSNNASGNKNDKIDARSIAEYLKTYHPKARPMVFNSKVIEELNIYRISHDRITKEHARYTNKLIFIIKQYFPLYLNLFSSSNSKVLLKLIIKYPKWENLKSLDDNEITNFLIENKYRTKKNISKVLDKIRNYEQLISKAVETGLSFEAITIARVLLTIKEELENIEKRMKSILDNHKLGNIFLSLPGASVILASKLLSLFGDCKERFEKANNIQCLFGTAPMNYQSGNYHKVLMRRACNKKARATLYLYAFCSLNHCNWARKYYDSQKEKGKTHSIAIRALSNKWIKIIFSMWKKEIIYSDEKYLYNNINKVA
jgi:transposase